MSVDDLIEQAQAEASEAIPYEIMQAADAGADTDFTTFDATELADMAERGDWIPLYRELSNASDPRWTMPRIACAAAIAEQERNREPRRKLREALLSTAKRLEGLDGMVGIEGYVCSTSEEADEAISIALADELDDIRPAVRR